MVWIRISVWYMRSSLFHCDVKWFDDRYTQTTVVDDKQTRRRTKWLWHTGKYYWVHRDTFTSALLFVLSFFFLSIPWSMNAFPDWLSFICVIYLHSYSTELSRSSPKSIGLCIALWHAKNYVRLVVCSWKICSLYWNYLQIQYKIIELRWFTSCQFGDYLLFSYYNNCYQISESRTSKIDLIQNMSNFWLNEVFPSYIIVINSTFIHKLLP